MNNFSYVEFDEISEILKSNKKKIIFNGTEENLYKTLLLGGLNQKIKWIDLYKNENLSTKVMPGDYLFIVDNPYFSSLRITNANLNQYKNNILVNRNQNSLILDVNEIKDEDTFLYFYNRSKRTNKLSLFLDNKNYKNYEFEDKIKILLPKSDTPLKLKIESEYRSDFLGIVDREDNLILNENFIFKLNNSKYEFLYKFIRINDYSKFELRKINNCDIFSQKTKLQSLIIFDLKCY